jgi:hypothetical protein
MVYVKISLNVGSTYTIPLKHLNILFDEISESINGRSLDHVWTLRLVEMTPEEYDALPEFEGH